MWTTHYQPYRLSQDHPYNLFMKGTTLTHLLCKISEEIGTLFGVGGGVLVLLKKCFSQTPGAAAIHKPLLISRYQIFKRSFQFQPGPPPPPTIKVLKTQFFNRDLLCYVLMSVL